jgi:hypothetical protein
MPYNTGLVDVGCTILVQEGCIWPAFFEHVKEPSGSIKWERYVDWISGISSQRP